MDFGSYASSLKALEALKAFYSHFDTNLPVRLDCSECPKLEHNNQT